MDNKKVKIEILPFNKVLVKYEFFNDSELIKFAKEFSDNYKIYSAGEYFSDNKNYHIKYSKTIIGQEFKTEL